ncbi:hypothetical protein Poli38472_003820 [Pythium oligandrum]|uniref:Uncharacterized protein n=1 Tax=Pythium oligandrum TaxID=41045 RepID=A0A8K1CMJ4_PYTOL|nr:hypothetical protein Poli38472_003820 [Pythium oligandrum]|eukprot:TMW66055.1 hypothetical protein Poli38472_003820 [Pythium oligandrum]
MQSSLGIDLKSIGEANKHALHEAIEVSSHAVFQRFGRPQWLWKVERLLNIGHEAKLKSSVEVLYTCIHEIVRQSVDRMAQKKQSGEDIANETCKSIVELFLESPQSGEDGLTLDDFVPFILTLVFA